jgi:hypothetical protein
VPRYRVEVQRRMIVTEMYYVDADDREEARERAESGDVECQDRDIEDGDLSDPVVGSIVVAVDGSGDSDAEWTTYRDPCVDEEE